MYRFNNGRTLIAVCSAVQFIFGQGSYMPAQTSALARSNDTYIGIIYKYRYITDECVNM